MSNITNQSAECAPMRLGITYLYTIFRYGYPHSVDDALKAIVEIRKLGFRYLEMEGLGRPMMTALYARRSELQRTVEGSGVHVHNLCIVDPELVSLDPGKQAEALEGFKTLAEVAAMLGAETLHLASYAPPVQYALNKPYQLGGAYSFGDQFQIRIPQGFAWNDVWRALVKSCQSCADIAAQYGKTVLMEPRVGEVVCSVDSQLRLIEHVNRPNFKANFDTAHFSAQRGNVVLALAKLCGLFGNIHLADNNPVNVDHVAVGDGTIEWAEFFRVLRTMRYSGYLGLDLGMKPSLLDDYRKSVERVQALAAELQLKIEV